MDSQPSALWCLALALVPGAVILGLDRGLMHRIDDPALPERLMARRAWTALAAAVPAAAIGAVAPQHLWWSAPLVALSTLTGGLPLRRRLHGETWSLPVYLWFMSRLMAAAWGFWLLLVLTPWLADRDGWQGLAVPLALAVVLLLWNEHFGDVFRFVLGAMPLSRPDLLARFHELVARTTLPMPRFDVVPMHGGVLANAVALPSLGRSGVAFTETLLTRFTPDEVTAVCAHELGHLEHYNPKRLRWLRLSSVALILAGALWTPVLRAAGQPVTPGRLLIFAFLVLASLVLLAHRRQQHETASDVRAVALTGGPEALASALVKLHVLARLPRRWDRSVEEHASHPSLARRLQAIRTAAAAPPAALGEASTFPSADRPGASVTFHDDRLVWTEAATASHVLGYDQLTELRVKPVRNGAVQLVAADAGGRNWVIGLRAEDLARAQSLLDVVDVRLSAPANAKAAQGVGVLVALLAGLIALVSGQMAAGLVVLVVAFDASRPASAAAGAAALAGAALMVRDGTTGLTPGASWPVAVLLLTAAFFASVAWRGRDLPVQPVTRRLTATISVFAALLAVPVVLSSTDALGFHLASAAWPALSVCALAAAAPLACRPQRWTKAVSALAATAGVLTLAAGTPAFLARAVDDPFLVAAPSPREVLLDTGDPAMTAVPVMPIELRVAPDGTAVAMLESDGDGPSRVRAGRPGGPLTEMPARDAQFVDGASLLVLAEDDQGMSVRRVAPHRTGEPAWEHRIAGLVSGALSVDASTHRWRVIGHALRDEAITVEGDLAGGLPRTRTWPAAQVRGAQLVGASGDALLAIDYDYEPPFTGVGAWLTFSTAMMRAAATVWRIGLDDREPVAASAFPLECSDLARGPGQLVCVQFDGRRTHVVGVDPGRRSVSGLVEFPGRLYVSAFSRGWVTGWSDGGRLMAVHLDSGTLIRVPRGAHLMASAGPWLAIATADASGASVAIHEAPPSIPSAKR